MIKDIMKNKNVKKAIPLLIAAIIALILYEIFHERESMYVGTIEVTKVYVSPRVSSQVGERLVDEGMIVLKDQILYRLKCEDIGVEKTKLTNDIGRADKMLASGTMAPQNYDKVRADYDINAYQWDWCTVRAPLTATVLTKFSEPGEWVQPGVKMMALGDMMDIWAYVYVPQPMLARLPLGMKVTGVLPELDDKKISGHIIKINDVAEFTPKNAQTRRERTRLVFGIKIKFDNSEKILKPGMPIEVTF